MAGTDRGRATDGEHRAGVTMSSPTVTVAIAVAVLALGGCSAPITPPVGNDQRRATHGDLAASRATANAIQAQPPAHSCHARGSGFFSLPDPTCTPGAINPAVTPRSIRSTICRQGWTDTVRPPERVTEAEKRASLRAYGDTGPLRDYEYDHLVPLELGGAVNDPRNLWPEPGASPIPKDTAEQALNSLVCRGRLSLAVAQRLIAANWVSALDRYVSAGKR